MLSLKSRFKDWNCRKPSLHRILKSRLRSLNLKKKNYKTNLSFHNHVVKVIQMVKMLLKNLEERIIMKENMLQWKAF